MEKKYYSIVFGIGLLVLGIILSFFNINKEFLGHSSISSYLISVGIIAIAIGFVKAKRIDKKVIDERMIINAFKANRATYISFLIIAFGIIIIDGIKAITVPYSLFMSYITLGSLALNMAFYLYYNKV